MGVKSRDRTYRLKIDVAMEIIVNVLRGTKILRQNRGAVRRNEGKVVITVSSHLNYFFCQILEGDIQPDAQQKKVLGDAAFYMRLLCAAFSFYSIFCVDFGREGVAQSGRAIT